MNRGFFLNPLFHSHCPLIKMKFILLLCIFLLFCVYLQADDISKPALAVSSGITLDIAPFGIEQLYFTLQGFFTTPGILSLAFKPAISVNESSLMLRLPLYTNLRIFNNKKRNVLISGYLGGGVEVYKSDVHNTLSPLFTAGIYIVLNSFYIDIPAVSAFRSYNTDSDIGITAGYYFQW